LVCASSYGISNNVDDEIKRLTLINLNINGEIISETISEDLDISIVAKKLVKTENRYYISGWQQKPNDLIDNTIFGALIELDLEGLIVNIKKFYYPSNNTGDNRFYDFTQTPDSGFLCVGYTQYYSTDSIGPYRAWLVKTDKYGCIVQDCQLTGLEDKQGMQELSIFPNPSQNVFFINSSQEIKNVSVFTINGKRILENNTNSTFAKIDLTDFSSGIYFVEIQTEKETIRKKLVKVE
jgi:hypothetical protein